MSTGRKRSADSFRQSCFTKNTSSLSDRCSRISGMGKTACPFSMSRRFLYNKNFHALLKTGRGYWQMVKYWPKHSKTTAVFYDGQFGRNYRLFLKMI
jgi:hypothetical protein